MVSAAIWRMVFKLTPDW